jgi:hypothetical protein
VTRALLAAFLVATLAAPATARVLRYEEVEHGPFDEKANAALDIDAALLAARGSGKHVLAVLGGNWCHDSRALARYLEDKSVKRITDANFIVVLVDVGRRDRNLDVAARFKAPDVTGTPTILVLDSAGRLLNAKSTSAWTSADSRSADEFADYLGGFAVSR